MSADNLTVCVTNFGARHHYLSRALQSVWSAGVKRVTVASVCPSAETIAVIEDFAHKEWRSFTVARIDHDIGCNNTWLLAAYHATTKRIIVLHDDDLLKPEFGVIYETVIGPAMDRRDAGFVSWEAELRFDDDTTQPCPFWEGSRTLMKSTNLLKVVGTKGRLSLSPVVSVLNRTLVIRACKEAADSLTANACYEHPGMLLGTEIIVYLRHIQTFHRWLYLSDVLSQYGSHAGSGTVKAQKEKKEAVLCEGYDLARDLGAAPASAPRPRLLLVYSDYTPTDPSARERHARAQASWRFHFEQSDVIALPYWCAGLPKLADLLDYACALALPEDIVFYANADAGLTTMAPERIIAGVDRGQGVTCCDTREMRSEANGHYKSVTNYPKSGGIDIVAMTPSWWRVHRSLMPDMFIGREGWDNCFAELAEEWADGKQPCVYQTVAARVNSKAHTDNVCWHEEHAASWKTQRTTLPDQVHNRSAARAFFAERGNTVAVAALK